MRTFIGLVMFGLLAGPAPLFAQSSEYGIPAHVSRVDGRALLEREGGGEDLERNLTLTEGDRIRTESGRVEILFADGTLLHLDRNTIVDFQREDFVRVMEGRARWHVAREARGALRVDTPAATLELDPGGDYRVAVAPNGDAELAVLRGSGALLNDHGDTALRAGERAVAAMGRAPSQAFYSNGLGNAGPWANAASWDDFDRWSDGQRRAHATAISARYLPNELHAYGSVFDSYGSWRSHAEYGYVWYPVAASGWQPYSHGRWHSYPRYGWTWIGRDAWAWPTHHFGRWGFSAGVWFWIPGRSWGPAWVAWASSPGYVGWSPLGWNDHPIYRVNVYNSYASGYPWCGWTFIRERHFGGRSWSAGDIFIGTSVAVVARGGITPSATSPAGRRAIPRNGVASGTAVPRGGSGLSGSSGSAEGGLAGVPSARPRRIPTGTITTGSTGSRGSTGSTGSVDRRAPREGSSAPAGTTAQPRVRSGTAPAQNRPAAEPRAAQDRPAAGARTAPAAGRPIRQAPSAGARDDAGPGRAQPRTRQNDAQAAPSSPAAPRARERSEPPPAASRPSPGARARESRSTPAPERAPDRAATPRSESSPRGSAPAVRAPSGGSRPAPSAGSRPAPSAGGGGERPAPPKSGGQAQPRPRGGG